MDFRRRLIATLRAVRAVLDEPGVLVVGSEVPNLLEERAAATLVVSQDVDLGVPVGCHAAVKARLGHIAGLRPSPREPSVWAPETPDLLEVNFVGMDAALADPMESYVVDDVDLPLLVFGALSLLTPGDPVVVEDLTVPVPRIAGLLIEKLLSDRSGEKGERDLLVALGLLTLAGDDDLVEFDRTVGALPGDLRQALRSNLTILSLLEPRAGMPDPLPQRDRISALLSRVERTR